MNRVKICGMTNSADALKAAQLGAWAVGFIFSKKSKRNLGAFKAKKIISELPPFVTPVGVFVDQKEGAVKQIAKFCGLRVLQFHGEESVEYCKRFSDYKVIKVFRVKDKLDLALVKSYVPVVSAFLFDTYVEGAQGGTGHVFNWKLIRPAKDFGKPIMLSGGLNPQNVRQAMEEVKPYAVDLASGVEDAPGKKSANLMASLFSQLALPISE